MPVRIVAKPVVTTPEAIAAVLREADASRELRRRRRLDAHVLAGQDVDRRADRPAQAARPSPHPVQPRPAVVGDRHGLHEPEPVRARRPRVRVHPDPPAPRPQDGRRPLGGPGGRAPTRRRGRGRRPAGTRPTGCGSPGSATTCVEVAVTEGDKVEAQARLGFSVNGYGVNELVGAGRGRRRTPRSTSLVTAYEAMLRRGTGAPSPAGTATRSCGRPPGSKAGSRRSSTTAGSGASPTRSRTWATSTSCPGSASSG